MRRAAVGSPGSGGSLLAIDDGLVQPPGPRRCSPSPEGLVLTAARQGRLRLPITSPYRAGVCLRSADDRDPHAEVVGPGLPEPVGREGRARQAASEGKADAVGQAQARTVAVERSCQAGIQTPEGTD